MAREARLKTGIDRIFQVLRADTLAVEKQARHADRLVAFQKWQAPSWVHGTVALR